MTNGDTEEIKLLFGEIPETEDKRHEHEPNPAINHVIKGVSFGFEDKWEEGVFLLTSFEVETKQAVIEICGKTISLGQPISNLGSVKFNTDTDGNKAINYKPVNSDDPFLGMAGSSNYNATSSLRGGNRSMALERNSLTAIKKGSFRPTG